MSDDLVTITVNGKELKARRGAMLIEVTDEAGITVPRFCYHKKLSIAANCRMCLVEVEKSWKPLPACATPVSEGMVVHTNSPRAIAAQKSTLEFLLINHPLDCPICDQGGECELQDIAMGYGDGVGQYSEQKRVVKDKDIGPLIATDMTRCIHCTRCVRFGEEVAGLRELGATGRSEHMEIGTYVAKTVTHELSGNVIDLCPVGALTAKPSRYKLRPWELVQHKGVSAHDATGSGIYMHTRDGMIMRVVPRDNEAINETWLSDRDRYSYEGVYSDERLHKPMIKRDGQWQEAEWDEALSYAAQGLREVIARRGKESLASLVSPAATLEEQYLLQKLTRALGSASIDHRLRQADFSDQASDPVMPWLGMPVAEIDRLDAVLVVGSNLRGEQPILAHRLRTAALAGAEIAFANVRELDYRFPVAAQLTASPAGLVEQLAGVAKLLLKGEAAPAGLAEVIGSAPSGEDIERVAGLLEKGSNAAVFIGAVACAHPAYATLRALSSLIAERSGSRLGYLPLASNSAGAWLAGAVPHRQAGGKAAENVGRSAAEILSGGEGAFLLHGVEPEFDSLQGAAALDGLAKADFVVSLNPYVSEAMKDYADVILPIGTFAETSGTYVNAEGLWQANRGVAKAVGESRPGWKVLRVLGNLLDLDGFDYMSSEDVRSELQGQCLDVQLDNAYRFANAYPAADGGVLSRIGDVAMYSLDGVIRRAPSLQATLRAASDRNAVVNSATAERLGLQDGDWVTVKQGFKQVQVDLVVDNTVPEDCVWLPTGTRSSAPLGGFMAPVEVMK